MLEIESRDEFRTTQKELDKKSIIIIKIIFKKSVFHFLSFSIKRIVLYRRIPMMMGIVLTEIKQPLFSILVHL